MRGKDFDELFTLLQTALYLSPVLLKYSIKSDDILLGENGWDKHG